MSKLDNLKKILKLQGGDVVIRSIESFPEQLRQSLTEAAKVEFTSYYSSIKNVVVCGMGGSRFPAFIIKELFKKEIKLPYLFIDNYDLPGFVDEKTLVVLSSYSGTTEEVLSCAYQAKERKAKITGLTVGGELKKFFQENQYPYYKIHPYHNPSGQPRIGFGYFVGGHLGLLVNLRLIDVDKKNILSAIDSLDSLTQDFKVNIPKEKNTAKKLAESLFNHYPFYITAEFLTGVGNALANQTNETAKSIADFRVIPELNHHLMEGLKFPKKIQQLLIFVFFFSSFYSPKIQKRFAITKEVVEKNNVKTLWYSLKGKNKIEQAFELMSLGSYLSMYLSVLYEQDPKVIPYVDYFKKRLKE